MRRIERTAAFKRDYRRAKASPVLRDYLDVRLEEVIDRLRRDEPLHLLRPYRDHALSGTWAGYRECHVRPDLLLIYTKPAPDVLRLIRLGSHSDLFG